MTIKVSKKQTLDLAKEPTVSNEGMAQLGAMFYAFTDYPLPTWFSPLYDTKQQDPSRTRTTPHGTFPISYSGKIAKRLAQLAYNAFDVKLTDAQVCELGTIAGNYRVTSDKVIYDIVNYFDWRAGDYGDCGSCFWESRAAARPAMEDAGCLAIRFYNERNEGIGRAWIAPLSSGNFVIFNAYARNGTWLYQNGSTLKAMATILSERYGLSQADCYLSNYGSACGTLWINNGVGIALYETIKPGQHIDLEIDVDDDLTACVNCGAMLEDHEQFYVEYEGTFCEDCYCDLFGYCEHCEETIRCDDLIWLEEEGISLCEYCFSESYTHCDDCGEIIAIGDSLDGLCADCASGHVTHCGNCGEVYDIANGPIPHKCTNLLDDGSGWKRQPCNHPLTIRCASCGHDTPVSRCYLDEKGLHYCQDCRGNILVDCALCHNEYFQAYVHSHGNVHYCFDCWPTFIPVSASQASREVYGLWNRG